jgi:hypothetical protein
MADRHTFPTRAQTLAKALEATPSTRAPRARRPAPLVEISLRTIELGLGGREGLVASLAFAPKDYEMIAGLIGDPRRAHTPLAVLCAEAGVRPGELLEAYKKGEELRAQALSIAKVGAKLADVAADTMRRAIPHEVTCGVCRGRGTVTAQPTKKEPDPQPETCESCQGTGILGVEGDLEHKKLALDMGKLLPRSGGMSIAVQQNNQTFAGGSAGGALEALQAATDAILWGDGVVPPQPAVDAEVEVLEADLLEAEGDDQPPEAPGEAECSLEADWRGEPPLEEPLP